MLPTPQEPRGGEFVVEMRNAEGGMVATYWPVERDWCAKPRQPRGSACLSWPQLVATAITNGWQMWACRIGS
jgi:hypothetical protein